MTERRTSDACTQGDSAACCVTVEGVAAPAVSSGWTQDSPKPDVLAKFGLLIGYSISLFLSGTPAALGLLSALLASAMVAAHVSIWSVARAMAPVYALSAILLIYQGATSGWLQGAMVVARILLLTAAGVVLLRTTSESELGFGVRRLLNPLGRLGLPAQDWSAGLMLALRFMPLMADELALVRKAQAARGLSFCGKNPIALLRACSNAMVPVLVGMFRRADRLACAMDVRCYGANKHPTSLQVARFGLRDGAVCLIGIAVCLGIAFWC